MSLCVFVCPLQAIPQKPFKSPCVKLGRVTASDMRMHRVLILLTLTFIRGHPDRNHENNKCLTISKSIQAMPIKFAVKVVRLKVYIYITLLVYYHCQSGDTQVCQT